MVLCTRTNSTICVPPAPFTAEAIKPPSNMPSPMPVLILGDSRNGCPSCSGVSSIHKRSSRCHITSGPATRTAPRMTVAKGGGEPGGKAAGAGAAAEAVALAARGGAANVGVVTGAGLAVGAAGAVGAAVGATAGAAATLAGTCGGGVKAAQAASMATPASATGRRVHWGMRTVGIGRGTLVTWRSRRHRASQLGGILRQPLCPRAPPDYAGRDKVCT